ncbi:hypothetical protein ACFX13_001968 [Malus domestica]|uniref:E3 ubiquitin-protein ligase BIG BROTHER-like n=1 Tax=Malus domestica TaxID=3750 RepID=UPI0004989414
MGNRIPTRRSNEHEYPPEAVEFSTYIFGDHCNTPPATGPPPYQTVPVVILAPPNRSSGANRFQPFGVAQSSHLGSSSYPSRSFNRQLLEDEALAHALQMQELENDYQHFSMQEHYRDEIHDNVDVDNMNYEELQALEETNGSVDQGLSEEILSMLPSHKYKPPKKKVGSTDEDSNKECSICMMEYKRGDAMTTLPCSHQYHEKCIKKWLENDKKCCICKKEVMP